MEYGYTPYTHKKKTNFLSKLPKIKLPKSAKKWIAIIAGIIIALFLIVYLCLGELRFFANHYLGLTFFSKNYVVLLQNNYELRPGGGFITGYGTIDTFMGFTSDISFKNSYDIDTKTYVTPPYPHEDLLKNEWYQGYTFRDANWDPSFPGSTVDLIKFYKAKFPKRDVDGFIVVNFSMIEDLIGKLGGVEVNGKAYTKDNLFSQLEFEVNNVDRHNVEALNNRKNVLGDLAASLMGKAKWHPFKTRDVIVSGLHNKDMYIWLNNNRLQNKLITKGWANTLKLPERSDFLAMNLANLGSKKADRYIQTEVHYHADVTKEMPVITAEVTLRYPGSKNTYSDDYKGYLRLYIPGKSTIEKAPVDSKTETNGDFKSIGAKIVLPAGSKASLTYNYTLPRYAFKNNQFQLRLAKQSGSETFYKLTVEAAEGKLIKSSQFDARENRATYVGQLKNDIDLSLAVVPDSMPPYPIEQQFKDLSHVEIIWNEAVDVNSATKVTNYSVSDLNKNNATVTDKITVKSAKLAKANVVELELTGITKQDLEHYQIKMNGLKDTVGNVITPNPKTITAVQRIKKAVKKAE